MKSAEPVRNIPVLTRHAPDPGDVASVSARFLLTGLSARATGLETELIDLAEADLPLLRERPDEAASPPPNFPTFRTRIAASRRAGHRLPRVQRRLSGSEERPRPPRGRHLPPQAHRHRHRLLGRLRRSRLPGASPAGLPRDGRSSHPRRPFPIASVDSVLDQAG